MLDSRLLSERKEGLDLVSPQAENNRDFWCSTQFSESVLSDELNSVAISNSNKYFAVGGAQGVLRLFEFSSGKFITDCRAHSGPITSVVFSADDR